MKLPLLAVRDHWRSRFLELLDGLADGRIIKGVQTRVRAVPAGTNGLEQLGRPRNTTDGFSRDGHSVAEPATARRQ